ncbi:hypothetical protein EYF80_009093 [Liparis tanakae]|uniref:Uncharacterized protein n=1 Tax=Liparis tanakae TaxID=230148 RepID=A0A4Z2IS46_9TELE|nr:hypothetical protein EYF80_009093 [Liparis tanakae]
MYIPSLPSHTHHPPPTLPQRDTHRVPGEKEAIRRVEGHKASHVPPALVSPHNLGSAMSSPVTLPYNNLGEDRKREKRDYNGVTAVSVELMNGCGVSSASASLDIPNRLVSCVDTEIGGKSAGQPQHPQQLYGRLLTCTTPAGLTPIITHIPLKAESFSSLSLIFLNDVHLGRGTTTGQRMRFRSSVMRGLRRRHRGLNSANAWDLRETISVSLTLGYGPQDQDARLLDDPVGVEEQAFQERQEVGQQVVAEHVGQHVQRCSGTLSCIKKTSS